MRHAVLLRIIAVLVGLDGVMHGAEAARRQGDPPLLTGEHIVVCIAALVAAYALWRGARWSPWALAAFGVLVAGLVVSLGPLLSLGDAERGGLYTGAAAIVVLTALGVWYAHRQVTRVENPLAAR